VLLLLFSVRVVMALQFQAIAVMSPVVQDRFAVGLAEIGFLFGLYLAPGIVFALPGGALGRWFGDRRMVVLGLVLMTLGGALAVTAQTWEGQVAARGIAGIGGVLLNVLMSKMVADWFAGREISTAMAIFVNSWPTGIALGLLALPWVEAAGGFPAAMGMVAGLCFAGLVVMALLRADPETGLAPGAGSGGWPRGAALMATVMAGSVWGLMNVALGMVFGFGPTLLAERGWSLAAASAQTSLAMVALAVAIPVGGVLADRTGRRDLVIAVSMALFAVAPGAGGAAARKRGALHPRGPDLRPRRGADHGDARRRPRAARARARHGALLHRLLRALPRRTHRGRGSGGTHRQRRGDVLDRVRDAGARPSLPRSLPPRAGPRHRVSLPPGRAAASTAVSTTKGSGASPSRLHTASDAALPGCTPVMKSAKP